MSTASSRAIQAHGPGKPKESGFLHAVSAPARWLNTYDDFITKNSHQVSQIESTLRSLTYIIPGRFRDAEIASESIHSGVQLLSLYHDTLLRKAQSLSKIPVPPLPRSSSLHNRYTRYWTLKSPLYRRVAYVLQIVSYVELLCEMAAKKRGERTRWRVVILLEAVKAVCKLLLLRITRSRPLVSPALPEREPIPEQPSEEEDSFDDFLAGFEEDDEDRRQIASNIQSNSAGLVVEQKTPPQLGPHGEWTMPRTGMTLPPLPAPGDITSYLLSRVLTADDIKPAAKLVNRLQGPAALTAEVLHILAPVVFAVAMARYHLAKRAQGGTKATGKTGALAAWAPWVWGIACEMVARQLRDRGLRTTPLEREEWSRRGWALAWWAMRGAFYDNVTKGLIEGVRRRMPGFVAGIIEDYEYLWENYYFSTSND